MNVIDELFDKGLSIFETLQLQEVLLYN